MFWCLARHNPKKWTVEKIAAFLFAVGLSLAALRGWWRGGIEQFGKESVLAGCWLLGVAWTVWAVKRRTEDNGQRRDDGPASHEASQGLGPSAEDGSQGRVGGGRSLVLWGVVATPFLSGIGTNTSIADYAGQGTIFFLTVGFLLIGLLSDKQLKGWALVALVGICFLQASRVSSSLLQMYRVGSVLRQTKLLEIGPEAGRLRVDSATAGQISSLNEALVRYGFHRGDPVIGVDGLCGLVYLSGGTSPGVPWFFAGQHNYLRGVLQKLPKETLAKSWVLIRSGTNLRDLNSWWNPNDVPPPGFKAKLSGFEIDPTLTEDILLYAPISRREPCDP